ncbi:MAG: P-loop NTPase fold protein [Planctomycetota bacterium]
MEARIQNDEPTRIDRLSRESFVEALAQVAFTADTPVVIGLYGRWGIGKTSLLDQIRARIERERTARTVSFDAWRHQFDEHPALALLQTTIDTLGDPGNKLRKTFDAIARGLGSFLLKSTANVELGSVEESLSAYEANNFLVREARVRLQQRFREFVEQARGGPDGPRIVFLIDDLDRCLPRHTLMVLESLKLFLNLPGCAYFLAVDRAALEASIRQHYQDSELDEISYLDKIVQLPFTIPPIAPERMQSYIVSLLPPQLRDCVNVLGTGLPRNPRAVKRFVNTLLLNHHLASQTLGDHQPEVLAVLLLVQLRSPALFGEITARPELLHQIAKKGLDDAKLDDAVLADAEALAEVAAKVQLPDAVELRRYIFLTGVARVSDAELTDRAGFFTGSGVERLLVDSGELEHGEAVVGKLLLFRTATQRTWLVATNRRMFCLLDDDRTRQHERVIQWHTPIASFATVEPRAYVSPKGRNVIDVGRNAPWLYSTKLHPDPRQLESDVRALAANAVGTAVP